MRILIIILAAIILPACVQLKAPERLVSDTYHTGKEIYRDISGTDEGEKVFVHEIIVHEGSDITLEKGRCVDELVDTTRENHNIESYEVSRVVHSEGNTETVFCEIKAVMK